MTLKTAIANDISVLFNTDEFAVTITYANTSTPAVVRGGLNKNDINDLDRSTNIEAQCHITIPKCYVSSVAYRDVVVISGVTWYMRRELDSDEFFWELLLTRDERVVP